MPPGELQWVFPLKVLGAEVYKGQWGTGTRQGLSAG